ncbi:hypothetical protein Tco_0752375 [Tanacetum coccineum]|uniref:Uncharacterized protein n=1 Tax=Tanacetum coccineum TaxID=301880 RepID=A0ABQ4Z6N6_9ASTR
MCDEMPIKNNLKQVVKESSETIEDDNAWDENVKGRKTECKTNVFVQMTQEDEDDGEVKEDEKIMRLCNLVFDDGILVRMELQTVRLWTYMMLCDGQTDQESEDEIQSSNHCLLLESPASRLDLHRFILKSGKIISVIPHRKLPTRIFINKIGFLKRLGGLRKKGINLLLFMKKKLGAWPFELNSGMTCGCDRVAA